MLISLQFFPLQMRDESALLGWSGGKTAYCCADGVEVRVKRQDTVRFTRMEETEDSDSSEST